MMPRRILCPILICALILLAVGGVALSSSQAAQGSFRDCPQCPEMVWIPSGTFVMGSPPSEPGRFASEGPQHPVRVRSFALSKYLISTEEFLQFLRATGYQPAPCDDVAGLSWNSPGHGLAYAPVVPDLPLEPAVCLNWYDAEAYVAWLNSVSMRNGATGPPTPYRLVSEAEWEYAARAGSISARWWGEGIGSGRANCNGCGSQWDGREIAPDGSFGPNPFGLFDVLGNVWQWTDDCWNENYAGAPADGSAWKKGDCTRRVLRGGSWSNVPIFVRSAMRSKADAAGRDFDYSSYAGFRVARSAPSG